ncbi:MetQ/NlpA family ABC transporter substrate-binding protein [Nocardiopsis sediminis]|uniref:Lipoprotein n=1 Tax=Nocardiopsis sediminis TaxID=1778267 RepID=A0ABV8FHY6_9ACTN
MRKIWAIIGAATLTTAVAACGSPSEQAQDDGGGGDRTTLRVGASPVPHAEILQFVQDELAADAGLNIEIVEFTDYNQPNAALTEGEIDANYFQNVPFLDEYLAANPDADLSWVANVHLEAFGLYSEDIEDIADLPDGAQVGIPNDPANLDRALKLLESQELITLDPEAGDTATENDVQDNPQDLELVPVEAAQLPRSLADVDAAVVNGNYALEADLPEAANALAWEDTEDNPYGNGLVVSAADADNEDIATLNELLHSDEVRTFIEEQWQGVVIPLDADA